MVGVREGLLGGILPYFAFGSGPPLVVLTGLTPSHEPPEGIARSFESQTLKPFARHFTVYDVNRRPRLPPSTTMHDIADDYARAIEEEFGDAVDAIGISTGGSVALQLGVDHPDSMRRLVLAGSACRLGPEGQAAQLRLAQYARQGKIRRGYREILALSAGSWWGRALFGPLGWAFGPRFAGRPSDYDDMLVTIAAEDDFDVSAELHRIRASTLLIAGERDRFYTPELFRMTADGIPGALLLLRPKAGHVAAVGGKAFARDALAHFGVH